MFANSRDDQSSQSSAVYVNRKGINELFEAMMTALMVHKPDDHISFIRECLNKVKNNHSHIPWDSFVMRSTRFPVVLKKKKALPPIVSTTPIIFILSSSGGTSLCSRLLERYGQLNYLLINDVANIDDDGHLVDLYQYEHRYDCVQNAIEELRLQVSGFLIAGELEEQEFLERWQEKLGRIDLIVILYLKPSQRIANRNFNVLQIDLNNDFEDILTLSIHHFDQIFPPLSKTPIILCIDYGHRSMNRSDLSMDHEFEMIDEEERNNSFMSTLCRRLAEQLSLKHLSYGDSNETYSKLKNEIHTSMNTCSGYIIDHFPTSSDDLKRFQSEIGPCSVLIYTGDHQRTVQSNNRAIYVDCRMEVDEIYDDLKNEILKRL